MFKQAFRFAFVALIWKQYKSVIISTILLFAYLFLVSNLHDDYISHLKLQQQSAYSGPSFIYKWLAYALGILIYFIFHWWYPKPSKSKKNKNKNNKEISPDEMDPNDDPFAQIRKRKTLRSRADFLDGKE